MSTRSRDVEQGLPRQRGSGSGAGIRPRASSTGERQREGSLAGKMVTFGRNHDDEPTAPTALEREKVRLSMRRLLAEARGEKCTIILGIVALVFSALFNLSVPYFFSQIIDTISAPGVVDGEAQLLTDILRLVVVVVLGSVCTFGRRYLFAKAGEKVVAQLRVKLFHAVMQQEIGFFDATRTGELLSRLGSDTSVLKSAVTSNISMGLRWMATVIGGFLFLFFMSWKLTLVMMAIVPFVSLGAVFYGGYVKKLSKKTRRALAKATEVAEESISSVRTVRSFAKEDKREDMYNARVATSLMLGLKTALAGGVFAASASGIATLSFVGIVWYGGTLVLSGEITPGILISFLLYSLTIGGALAGLASLFGDFMKAVGANDRVFQILDRTPAISLHGGKKLDTVVGHVRFDDVEFAYPTRLDQPVLRGANLDIAAGTVAALVGPSGGGKSTVVNLIERFYDVQGGKVTLDGVPLKDLDSSWLRSKIGLVRQEPQLFCATISENIAFGVKTASMQDVRDAAIRANAHNFVMGFPNGYDTMVGERGVRLSGGQKQRIAIARALLLNPKVLLLDEATSALDAESEHLVQEALDRLMVGRTVLIIAHRLSTVKNADVVMVLDGGKVQDSGTHAQLMTSSRLYRKLVKHQLQAAAAEAALFAEDQVAAEGAGAGAGSSSSEGEGEEEGAAGTATSDEIAVNIAAAVAVDMQVKAGSDEEA